MALQKSVRRVLELAHGATLEAEIPRELKDATYFCIAQGWAKMQHVYAVVWEHGWPSSKGNRRLFDDRPTVLCPPLETAALHPLRLLITDEGDKALLADRIESSEQPPETQEQTSGPTDDGSPQYVTRDQMAAIVQRHKETVADWFRDEKAPQPAIEGGGGKRHEYLWQDVRPWLEAKSGRQLPEAFPSYLRSI